MGSQHGSQTEAEILFSQYARNIVILQIESLLRRRRYQMFKDLAFSKRGRSKGMANTYLLLGYCFLYIAKG